MISTRNNEYLGIGGEPFEPILKNGSVYSFSSKEPWEWHSQQACTSILIMGSDGEVGRLSWDGGSFAFNGDMVESAQIFFDSFLKPLVDDYIQVRAGGNPVPPPV